MVRKEEILVWSCLSMVEARSMTELCCSVRACSWGVVAGAGWGDDGPVSVLESRWRLSMAGNELFVVVWFLGAVTVSWFPPVGLAAYASVDVNWPPKVLMGADCALWIAICL